MPRFLFPLLAVLLLAPSALAQQSAAWQQEVAYEMDVHLAADRHQMTGTQRLEYTNNSPDTLRQVYYHLYFNAFQPSSMMAERNRHLPDPDRRVVPRIFELGPDEIGYYDVRSLTQDGTPVAFDIDDTILEVDLARPILPGETSVFEMAFEAQVPLQTRRSGRDSDEGIDFSMTQWYPKMAAYDAIGWHADPYVGREFYAPFGTFDVRLTLPSEYVVGASGTLQNPEAVGHGYDQPPDIGLTSTGPATVDGTVPDSLTWHFRAERVHDFAWSADPDYLHARYLVRDVPGRDEPVELHLLYQPDAADGWAQLGDYTAALTHFFSERIAPYPYPQFTVAQGGDGGMEYPMITLITGRRSLPSLVGVTAHELVHMWFYGVLATNESDYSWMDEGFTSFMTTEAMHHVFAQRPGPASHAGARASVARIQQLDLWERPSKPADWYDTNVGFSVASYTGGAVLVDLLGYVMGDDVRDAFIKRYYDEFKFRHPYPADVQQIAQRTSGLQLDWLFEQYLEGEGRYDYGADDLDVERTAEGYRHAIMLRRHEDGVLPVDLRLRYDDGSEHFVTIPPVVMHGHKPVPEDWTVAGPWPWTSPTYTLTHESPKRVVEVQLDPENRMLDLDPANNRIAVGGPDIPQRFAGFLTMPSPDRTATTYALSPIGLYAHDYGVGVGAQLRAVRPGDRGTLQLGVTLWPEVIADEDKGFDEPLLDIPPPHLPPGDFPFPVPVFERDSSPLDGIDYSAVYTRPLRALGPLDELRFDAQKHLGVMENRVSLTKVLGAYPVLRDWDHTLTFTLGHQHRTSDRAFQDFDPFFERPTFDLEFLGLDSGFDEDHLLSARLDYRIGDDDDEIAAFAEVGGSISSQDDLFGRPSNANRLFVTATKTSGTGPFTGLARVAVGLGADRLSPQKRFGLGTPSIESRWRSHAYRVLAAAPEAPQDDLHFFALSGVGPVAYLLRKPIALGSSDFTTRSLAPITGTRLVAGSLALRSGLPTIAGLDRTWRAVLAPLQFEVFSGVGALGLPGGDFVGEFVADAGFGVRYDVSALRLGRDLIAQSDVLSGLRLVAKFPVWASDPEVIGPDEDAFGFRWLVGIETGL
jgi:hypothetical protein